MALVSAIGQVESLMPVPLILDPPCVSGPRGDGMIGSHAIQHEEVERLPRLQGSKGNGVRHISSLQACAQ